MTSAPDGQGGLVAILGGTGNEGKGLAYRWAEAGRHVVIGSRTLEKAVAAAAGIEKMLSGGGHILGKTNREAAALAAIVVVTVPYSGHRSTLEGVRDVLPGKLLIDVTVPLVPPKVSTAQLPEAGSAAQEAQQIVGPQVAVASAFQNISHELLLSAREIDCDVLVTGSSKEARAAALGLVAEAGLKGWDAGPLENSGVVEGLTSVLIHINKRYGSTHAGVRVTGVGQRS